MGLLMSMSCAVCYAVSYIFIRRGQAQSSPPDGGLLPILVISAFGLDALSAISSYVENKSFLFFETSPPARPLQAIEYAIFAGIIGTCVGRFALYRAINTLGATRGVIIKGLAPVVTVSVIALVTEEDILPGDWLGLACLVLSVTLLYCERVFSNRMLRSFELFRNSLTMAGIAAIAQGIGHAFRQLSIQHALVPLTAAAIDVTAALIFYLLVLAVSGKFLSFLRGYRFFLNLDLLWAGIASATGVILFFLSIQVVSVTTVSVIVATEPVIVALLSTVFFPKMERVSWWSGMAAIIVAMGVLLMNID